jgi:hypothetical protein
MECITNPFQHAQVFLSYSYDNKPFAINLYRQLKKHFWVWFDSNKIEDRPFQIGEQVVPEEKIIKSDFFICIASATYFDENRNAYKEWKIANESCLNDEKRIGIVCLGDYKVKNNIHQGRLYISEQNSSIDELIKHIKSRLHQLSGIVREKKIYVGGRKTDEAIRSIVDIDLERKPRIGSLLPISVHIPQIETEFIIHKVLQLKESDQESFTLKLLKIVAHAKKKNDTIPRMNAAYILSKLWKDKHKFSDIASKAVLGDSCPFEYRSSRVAASFLGNMEPIIEYSEIISNPKTHKNNANKYLNQNIEFHNFYYRSVDAALTAIRNNINNVVSNLMSINVITLGHMSTSKRDIEMLENKEKIIISSGVSKEILNSTIERISKKAKTKRYP